MNSLNTPPARPDPHSAWLHRWLDTHPAAEAAFSVLMATPDGGWPETRQAWTRFEAEMPMPWDETERRMHWRALNPANFIVVARRRGMTIHSSRSQ